MEIDNYSDLLNAYQERIWAQQTQRPQGISCLPSPQWVPPKEESNKKLLLLEDI